jgi:tRNA(Ile)-lysidine synthase TilS/MesJ
MAFLFWYHTLTCVKPQSPLLYIWKSQKKCSEGALNMTKKFQQKFLKKVKQAIYDYGMIENGDRVAVGLSGGKDSVTLLYALHLLRHSIPVKFEIEAIFIKTGWPMDLPVIEEFCSSLNVPFHIVETE